jgi:hypothetical protein
MSYWPAEQHITNSGYLSIVVQLVCNQLSFFFAKSIGDIIITSLDIIHRIIFCLKCHPVYISKQRFRDWILSPSSGKTYSQRNGPIWHVETCPDVFFTARVHVTKSTIKILAAITHWKYFLKLPKLLIFSVRGTACTTDLYNPLCCLISRPLQHSPRLSQPCCVLNTAPCSARGGHFSKGLAGYNIGSVQQFLKNTCSAY